MRSVLCAVAMACVVIGCRSVGLAGNHTHVSMESIRVSKWNAADRRFVNEVQDDEKLRKSSELGSRAFIGQNCATAYLDRSVSGSLRVALPPVSGPYKWCEFPAPIIRFSILERKISKVRTVDEWYDEVSDAGRSGKIGPAIVPSTDRFYGIKLWIVNDTGDLTPIYSNEQLINTLSQSEEYRWMVEAGAYLAKTASGPYYIAFPIDYLPLGPHANGSTGVMKFYPKNFEQYYKVFASGFEVTRSDTN